MLGAHKTYRLYDDGSSDRLPESEYLMRRTGYSLLELLVVMAIIALLLGFLLVGIQQVYAAVRRLTELVK